MKTTTAKSFSINLVNNTYIINILDNSFDFQNSQAVIAACSELIEGNNVERIALNFENVNYITTSGIGSLLNVYSSAARNYTKFVIYNVNFDVQDILTSTMVDTLLNIVDNEQSAILFE